MGNDQIFWMECFTIPFIALKVITYTKLVSSKMDVKNFAQPPKHRLKVLFFKDLKLDHNDLGIYQ